MGDIKTRQMINECCFTESYSVLFVPINWQKHDLAPFLPHLPKEIPTTAVSHYLFFFLYFVSTKVRNKNFVVLIVRIIMTLVVVARIIVVGMITTTNNGSFQFPECLECIGTVLSILYILFPCNDPMGKMLFPF